MQIHRSNPYLSEAVEVLDEHFLLANGDSLTAWERLKPVELDFIREEIQHCATDPRYYLENYHTIRTEQDGLKTLSPFWDSQEIFYNAVLEVQRQGKRCLIQCLKARQLGLSTICEGMVFWKTIFTPICNTLIVATDTQKADDQFEMSRLAYECLPWWMRPETRYDQKGRILQFDRKDDFMRKVKPGLRSNIFVEAANKTTGVARGRTIRAAHLSELATWEGGGKTLTQQIFPSMNADDVLAFMESTAEGRSGFWYNFWRDTMDGKTEWHPVFIPYYRVRKYSTPIRADETFIRTRDEDQYADKIQHDSNFTITDEVLNWRRKKIASFVSLEGDEFGFMQEYPCVIGATRVATEFGLIPIEDNLVGVKTPLGRITGQFVKGVKPVFTATTDLGYSVTGTAEHLFPTADGSDVQLSDLTGKIVRLSMPTFACKQAALTWSGPCNALCQIPVDAEFARFLGYFMGDGCFTGDAVSIVCDGKDEDVIDDVERLMERFFGAAHRRIVGSKRGGVELRVGAIGFKTVMQALGIWNPNGRPHRLVCVPEVIFESPKAIVREFLRGLYEADGFNQYGTPRVSFFSKHEQFLRDVQLLLLGFGVTSKLRSRPAVNGQKRNYTARTLDMRAAEARRFCEEVGFVGRRKAAKLREVDCPNGRPQAQIRMEDKVVSIEAAGEQQVYDITVEGTHTFSGNGMLVHNCNWIEAFQGAGICAFNKRLLYKMLQTTCSDPLFIGEINLDRDTRKPLVHIRPVQHGDVIHNPKESDRLWVWERPEPEGMYYVAADVAQGQEGRDFSVVEVLRIGAGMEPDVQVAEWRGWMNPTPFAYVVAALGYWYNDAEVSVECNNVGKVTNNELYRAIEYDNVYRWKHIDKVKNAVTNFMGWETNYKSREAIIAKMNEAILDRSITIRSKALVDEMLDFSYEDEDGGKAQGQSAHDDRIMSFMICRYCAHDSEYGKQALSRPMSAAMTHGDVYYVMDKWNRKVGEFEDYRAAWEVFQRDMGGSIIRKPRAVDYQNTAWSPIHNGNGIRSRMYYDMDYAAEEINHETIQQAEMADAGLPTNDPEAWMWG